jgi:hypothetical protein
MKDTFSLRGLSFLLGLTLILGITIPASVTFGSSHREAPLISMDPVADQTDLYAFVSPNNSDKVVLAGNYNPLGIAGAGPNYFRFGDDVAYAFHIDNDGDAMEDVSYIFKFKTNVKNPNTFLYTTQAINKLSDSNVTQSYDVYKVMGKFKGRLKKSQMIEQDIPVATPAIGSKSQPDYNKLAQEAIVSKTSANYFAGPRDDSFFVDLNVFDLLNLGAGVDSLAGTNVQSIVMEIDTNKLKANDDVIGIWGSTYRQAYRGLRRGKVFNRGRWVQISRLGMPLVNEVVVPLAYKDYFNSSHPSKDADTQAYVDVVMKPELAGLFKAVLGLNVPLDNRSDLVSIFLTGVEGLNMPKNVRASEMLRLNTSIAANPTPNNLGVFGGDTAGFPNGRRLADDVTDIAIQAVAGKLVEGYDVSAELGDGVNANDKAFMTSFPYLASPHLN